MGRHWKLDPAITFLNHGSFGATPVAVLEHQRAIRDQLEREPVRFFLREFQGMWDAAREAAARFVGAKPENLAFVANATTGVNTVLASIDWRRGDEIVVTNHEYGACRNAVERIARRTGASVVVVDVAVPIISADEIVEAVTAVLSPKTRFVLVDHVTSQTGLVLPVAEIVARVRSHGAMVMIDGAHAPGMIDLELSALSADFYTGNFHKWVCTPKASALLWVADQHLNTVRPLVTSHGASAPFDEPMRAFRNEFDWQGTTDPTPVLSVPFGIEYMASLVDGGWPEIRRRNRELALAAREVISDRLGIEQRLAPEAMIGSLAAVRLPDGANRPHESPLYFDPIQHELLNDFGIEVPVIPWPSAPSRILRVSAQLYNSIDQYARLGEVLAGLLGR